MNVNRKTKWRKGNESRPCNKREDSDGECRNLHSYTNRMKSWRAERVFVMILQEITGLKGMWIHVPAGGGELKPKGRLTSRSKRCLKLILDQLFNFYAVEPTVRNAAAGWWFLRRPPGQIQQWRSKWNLHRSLSTKKKKAPHSTCPCRVGLSSHIHSVCFITHIKDFKKSDKLRLVKSFSHFTKLHFLLNLEQNIKHLALNTSETRCITRNSLRIGSLRPPVTVWGTLGGG